ncbi:MAG TPA: ABC transporter substrate-binding protein [Chloroflexota bacterium]|jgi:ABC-type Fe3+ transport system substrate-binding protein
MSARYLLVSALLLGALAACAPAASLAPAPAHAPAAAPSPAPSAALQALIDGARKEGSLSFVWGGTTLDGNEGVRRHAAAFNKLYGLDLDERFTPGPAMTQMAQSLVQEQETERTASTDVFIGYGDHMLTAIRGNALDAVDWANWAPNVRDPRSAAAGGMAVEYSAGLPGITYNSTHVVGAAVPRTLQDLLKPEYKGRIAAQQAAAWFNHLAAPELWGEAQTMEYVRQFADQTAGFIRCTDHQRIAAGEFDLFALDCNNGNTLALKAQGAPVDFVAPADAPLIAPLYMAVPKRAAHPNAAKLWVNYVLSREGQDLAYETDFADSPVIPGSRTARDLERYLPANTKPVAVDLDFYERNDPQELSRIQTEQIRILQGR